MVLYKVARRGRECSGERLDIPFCFESTVDNGNVSRADADQDTKAGERRDDARDDRRTGSR